jgi:Na+-transporting methylmalonyl-CoA/oxaloacetate decarboxylase gamma subunit
VTNLEFGVTLTVLGMGGTLFILFLISLVIDLLNKVIKPQEDKKGE